jgi:hypothetical protein
MYDKIIKNSEEIPVRSLEEQEKEKNFKLEKFKKDFGSDPKRLKSAVDYYLSGYQTDQQRRDDKYSKQKKIKLIFERFGDELEKHQKKVFWFSCMRYYCCIHRPDNTHIC